MSRLTDARSEFFKKVSRAGGGGGALITFWKNQKEIGQLVQLLSRKNCLGIFLQFSNLEVLTNQTQCNISPVVLCCAEEVHWVGHDLATLGRGRYFLLLAA